MNPRASALQAGKVVVVIAVFVAASYLWDRYRPTSPEIEGQEAWFCRA